MAERFTSDLGFILFVLIVASILGFLIGYLIAQRRKTSGNIDVSADGSLELKQLKAENNTLSVDLKNAKVALEECQRNINVSAPLAGSIATSSFDASAAKEIFGKKIKENDLTMVEGIGPVISKILINAGISTWKGLADTNADKIKSILLEESDRHKIHDPSTWPKQASLADAGSWKELFDYQEYLDGGKEPTK